MIDTGLTDTVVLVTGADRGIGAATALAFAAQGARIAVHHHPGTASAPPPGVRFEHTPGGADAAEELVDRLIHAGAGAAATFPADLGAPGGPRALLDAVADRLGPVEVLVNNAAHCESPDLVTELTDGVLDRTYRVNVHAPALLISELARRHGTGGAGSPTGPEAQEWLPAVVNISTDAARAFPGQLAYGTSKAALEALTRATALDLGPLGVRVNAVAPGPVQTGWIAADLVERVTPSIPLRRVGDPSDIADCVVFLASRQARWITGQVVQVAGGHAL
ncbi:SDR family NAD(P)-dependent oxidoreductase [Actinoalloteichus caeruleus]|uniref:SDR family NAD(P)-dependent oxidoreductase n=1 Tax=Actinoalloteichus cyanogriseus TaxID=2893586 RepID=UPI0004AA9D7B|nr:SDR family oxidoreductase [Actinoalloteichus caeruleus]